MLHRTEGIVLRTTPFGEADLIVTHLTTGFGVMKTFAKSPRKTKSRFGSSLEPLTCSRISFYGKEDASLPRLTQSDILHAFDAIRSNLQCFLRASEIVELTLQFVPERDACAKVYRLLFETLTVMEEGCSAALRVLQYKLKFLGIVGFLPKLQGCGRCGAESLAFHLSHGAVICEACAKGAGSSYRLSPGVIALAANLLTWDTAKLGRIRPSEGLTAELTRLVDDHVRFITEKELRTRSFRA